MRSLKFISGAVCLLPTLSMANNLYHCEITRVSKASGDQGDSYEFMQTQYIGKTFDVDRSTGIMSGALSNSFLTLPEVIDQGSQDNSFKAVTTLNAKQSGGPGTNLHAIVIDEYAESRAKPFVYLYNSDVYFGTCTK